MKNLLFILLFCSLQSISAQRHEVGAKIGSSNIVGDIGKTNYIQFFPEDINIPIHIGAFYKRNLNPYQGIKLSLSYHHIHSDDLNAKEIYRNNRNRRFSNDILEGSLVFEYNFFPINNEARQNTFSPYIFGGISGLSFNVPSTNFIVSQQGVRYIITPEPTGYTKKMSFGIPFGVGLKYKFNYNWAVFGEITFRPTFTDDLDYNNIENSRYTVQYKDIPQQDLDAAQKAFNQYININKIGNLNSKDWLNSINIGISYSFGRPPCYCD